MDRKVDSQGGGLMLAYAQDRQVDLQECSRESAARAPKTLIVKLLCKARDIAAQGEPEPTVRRKGWALAKLLSEACAR